MVAQRHIMLEREEGDERRGKKFAAVNRNVLGMHNTTEGR